MLVGISRALVLSGAVVLCAALVPVYRLIGQLPVGTVRRHWHILRGLIVIFIVGYLGYASAFWDHHQGLADLIVPAVFFLGAMFVALIATLSLQTAIDIRRVTLLEQESTIDPLMGIHNRRYLDRRLAEEFARARRRGLPLSVLMLDIDHFKRLNDTWGHQVGDRVLRHLGGLLLGTVRETDVVARYGGDEIVVIAPSTARTAAVDLADRLRRHVASHELACVAEHNRRESVQVTVSVGVAELHDGDASCVEVVDRADVALFEAKRAGRNGVHVAQPAPPARRVEVPA